MHRTVYVTEEGQRSIMLRVEHSTTLNDITRVIAVELAHREIHDNIEANENLSDSEMDREQFSIESRTEVLSQLRHKLWQEGQQWWYGAEDIIEGADADVRAQAEEIARDLFPELTQD